MLGDVSIFSWMVGIIVFAIGSGAGFFIAQQMKDQRTRKLEQELEDTRNELKDYRGDVNRHFIKTSLLFNKLTEDYKEVYEHLAGGAHKLCDQVSQARDPGLPEGTILPSLAIEADETPQQQEQSAKPAPDKAASANNQQQNKQQKEKPAAKAEAAEQSGRVIEIKENAPDYVPPEASASEKPAPSDDDALLGADSTPGVDLNHKTHPAVH